MKETSSTVVPRLRDVRGRKHVFYPERLRVKSFMAFLSWELLQRGIAHNAKPMKSEDITLLCGGSASLPDEIQNKALGVIRGKSV